MATIGTFTKNADGSLTGDIVTLSVQAANVRIVPVDNRPSDNAPTHRVIIGDTEVGAGWTRISGEGREYLGLKLDDPSFAAPIFAHLFADPDGKGYSLIWSRSSKRNGD